MMAPTTKPGIMIFQVGMPAIHRIRSATRKANNSPKAPPTTTPHFGRLNFGERTPLSGHHHALDGTTHHDCPIIAAPQG